MTFWGVSWASFLLFSYIKGPKHPFQKSYSNCFFRSSHNNARDSFGTLGPKTPNHFEHASEALLGILAVLMLVPGRRGRKSRVRKGALFLLMHELSSTPKRPGHPGQILGIVRQKKLASPGLQGRDRTFEAHPFECKTKTPTPRKISGSKS